MAVPTGSRKGKLHVQIFVRSAAVLVWLTILACGSTLTLANPLTLEQALSIGLQSNPDVLAYQLRIVEAKESLGEAKGAFLPTLSLSYNRNLISDSSGSGGNTDYIDQESDQVVARLSQPIFSGFGGVAGLDKAYQGEHYARLELGLIKSQIASKIRGAFYDILLTQELVERRQSSVERLESQRRIAQAWVGQSMAPRIRLLEVEVELSNARQQHVTALANLAIARARLGELLAIEATSKVEVEGQLTNDLDKACDGLDACLALALEQRKELQLIDVGVDMARQDQKMVLARNLPRASLDLSWTDYQREYENELLNGDDRDYYSLGMSVSIQPFQGARNIFAWRRLSAVVKRLQQNRVKQGNTIVTEVKSALEQLQEGHARIAAATDGLTEAKEAYHLVSRSAELGVSSLRELLDTEQLLTEAEINMINARHALQLSRVQLDYVLGH